MITDANNLGIDYVLMVYVPGTLPGEMDKKASSIDDFLDNVRPDSKTYEIMDKLDVYAALDEFKENAIEGGYDKKVYDAIDDIVLAFKEVTDKNTKPVIPGTITTQEHNKYKGFENIEVGETEDSYVVSAEVIVKGTAIFDLYGSYIPEEKKSYTYTIDKSTGELSVLSNNLEEKKPEIDFDVYFP